MDDLKGLSIIIPVYEEEHESLRKLQHDLISRGAEVIVVDDGSKNPFDPSIKHGSNFGYGAALMTGIKNATNNVVMTMDGDGQHSANSAVRLYKAWQLLECDMLIGQRRLSYESFIRMLGRKMINISASLFAFRWLSDLNSGMRIFRKDLALGYFPILCRKFSFTTSLTLSMLCDNYSVEWFPVKVEPRLHGKSRVRLISDAFVTVGYILKIGLALRTRGIRAIWRNLIGFVYG